MKKNKFIYAIIALCFMVVACDPMEEEYALGEVLSKDDLKFSITPSSDNPNDIILTSQTPGVIPNWITPVGTSTSASHTVTIPFPGTYPFVYGALCEGGYVQADTFDLTVTTIDEDFVSGEAWTNLTGGFETSKTWVLDLNPEDGKSKYFNGPVYFAGIGDDGPWEWQAEWYDWIMPLGDYGTMTFDLIGNANFTLDNKMLNIKAAGKFMLFEDKMQLVTYGADVIHDNEQGGNALINWGAPLAIKTLTADQMQLIVVLDEKNWLIYNYVSKEYFDNN